MCGRVRMPMQWLRSTLLGLLVTVTESKLHPNQVTSAMTLDAMRQLDYVSSIALYLETSGPNAKGEQDHSDAQGVGT